jgi:hypothetical protein
MTDTSLKNIKDDFSLLMRTTQSELAKMRRANLRYFIAIVVLFVMNLSFIGFYFFKENNNFISTVKKSRK